MNEDTYNLVDLTETPDGRDAWRGFIDGLTDPHGRYFPRLPQLSSAYTTAFDEGVRGYWRERNRWLAEITDEPF